MMTSTRTPLTAAERTTLDTFTDIGIGFSHDAVTEQLPIVPDAEGAAAA